MHIKENTVEESEKKNKYQKIKVVTNYISVHWQALDINTPMGWLEACRNRGAYLMVDQKVDHPGPCISYYVVI